MKRRTRGFLVGMLFASLSAVCAEDFKMRDGTVYRQARVVEVRPDALILLHERGMAMVELAKLPISVQARYGYDPKKATAYRAREIAAQQAVAEENQRLIAAREARQMEISRAQFQATQSPPTPDALGGEVSLAYRANAADRAYGRAIANVAGEISQVQETRRAAASKPTTFWNAEFWNHPLIRLVGMLMGGATGGGRFESNSEPAGWR